MKRVLILLGICYIILLGVPFIVHAQNLGYDLPCISKDQCASLICRIDGKCGCGQDGDCSKQGQTCNTYINMCESTYGYQDSSFKCRSTDCADCVACTSYCSDGEDCTSSGTSGYGYQDSSFKCRSTDCADCVACTSYCSDGEDCTAGGGGTTGDKTYCHVQTPNGDTWMAQKYDTEANCKSNCGTIDCPEYGSDCSQWCCLNQNMGGQKNACSNAGSGTGGTGTSLSGGSSSIPNPLKCSDIQCLVKTIADFITGLVVVIGTIMIIIGGIQYITSAGNEEKARRAKNTVLYTIIGIAIAVSVDFIVGLLGEILGKK